MIAVLGAGGQLGTAFTKILPNDSASLSRSDLDLTNLDRIAPTIGHLEPSLVINCAAYTAVDRAESDEAIANRVNGYAVGELARVCREIGARFVTFSTDYVFDGTKDGGYVESDEPNPINAYGRSKLLGERLALQADPEALIIRTSWLLSGTHRNFITRMLQLLEKGSVSVVDDQFGRPTIVDDLAPATRQAIESGVTDILHLTNDGVTTWYELARQIADCAGIDSHRVQPCTADTCPTPAARPANSVLDSERMRTEHLSRLPESRPGVVKLVARQLLARR